jgi:uncharacterized protein (UPF0264 family)
LARLLVSVRSADEARAAVSGGADIIDVKEPAAGPLGCADASIWSEIRRVVPMTIPLSVALGELPDWSTGAKRFPPADAWSGISYAKMGLAGTGTDWLTEWKRIRSRFERDIPGDCSWVAVIYADWLAAAAPSPDEILSAAFDDPRCRGVLVDTWSKQIRTNTDPNEWRAHLGRVQRSGRLFAWAGGLGIAEIERLAESGLSPDIIAVRGSACRDGNRLMPIDEGRVARLREAVTRV